MYLPGAGEIAGIGESNIRTFVISKIEVVFAQWVFYPVRHPNKRGTLNVYPDAWVNIWPYDRFV